MNALYAFNRITDDLGDDESLTIEERRLRLAQWRELVRGAMSGSSSDVIDSAGLLDEERRYLPAISDMLARASIPHEYLFAVIDGVESDLHPMEVATFEELERYCYQVAGAVGLCCIHVWGFREGPKIRQRAIDCGLALQLTNILRDLAEDADRGRVYLPREPIEEAGITPVDIGSVIDDPRIDDACRHVAAIARNHYFRADKILAARPRGHLLAPRLMEAAYGRLLGRMEAVGWAAPRTRVRHNKLALLGIFLWLRLTR